MSALAQLHRVDDGLAADVLTHLEVQLASARGLLQIVLDQGSAIRARNVPAVVTLTGVLTAEMQRRASIEVARAHLLERAGARLGIAAGAVTLSLLTEMMDPASGALAQERSAELRGLLDLIAREHHVNRALMTQELAFLDHLLRLTGTGDASYNAGGDRSITRAHRGPRTHRMLDMEV